MSWEAKQDYCGLASGNNPVLKVKSDTPNNSSSWLEKLGQDGTIAATKLYGTKNASPSNEYTILKAGDITVQIGKVTTVEGKRYALQSVVYKKTAGGEPTLNATAVRIDWDKTRHRAFGEYVRARNEIRNRNEKAATAASSEPQQKTPQNESSKSGESQ